MVLRSRGTKPVTKSVRFSSDESALIEQISRREHLPEGTFMRKLVLEGLERYRLEQAIADYEAGEVNLGQAARRAGTSVQRMMTELDRRGIDIGSPEHFATSLETLADLFDESGELREVAAEVRARHRTEQKSGARPD